MAFSVSSGRIDSVFIILIPPCFEKLFALLICLSTQGFFYTNKKRPVMGRFFVIITEFYNIMDFTVATDFCTILAIISGENLSFCMLRTTSTVFSALPSTFLKQIFHIYYFLEEKHFYKKNLVVEQLKHTLSPFLLYNLCVAPIYKKPFFGILVIKISLYIFFCNLITLPIYVCVYPRILVMCQVH